ncbi:MAG TPA: hypothetical protein VMZ00_02545 [Sporichthya sp.]|nr:hypothetical protein [Sporichthya sp.]
MSEQDQSTQQAEEPQSERGAPGSRDEGGPPGSGPANRPAGTTDDEGGVDSQEPIDPNSPNLPTGDGGG